MAASSALVLGCAAPPQAPDAPEPASLGFVDAGLAPESADARPESEAAIADDAPCHDQVDAAQAKLACAGDRILVGHNLAFHPSRPAPAEPERSVLREVAGVMREHPEILLLRIEVYTSTQSTGAEEKKSQLEQAQLRASAIFNWLWRHEKLDAERLEGTGYAYDERISAADPAPWPVVLRVVQRAK